MRMQCRLVPAPARPGAVLSDGPLLLLCCCSALPGPSEVFCSRQMPESYLPVIQDRTTVRDTHTQLQAPTLLLWEDWFRTLVGWPPLCSAAALAS